MSSTVCRIILLLTLRPLSSGWQLTRNVWFGSSKLPTSTLIYFCLATSASSTIKKKFLSQSNSWIYSSFWDANLATHARAAVSEGSTFPILANRDFKEGWLSLWSGISAAKNEETTCSLKFTWSKCKKVCLLWDLLFVSNFPWCCLLFWWLSTENFLSYLTNTSQRLHRKSPARYSWQVCLTFAIEDLACFGILCFASYNLKDHVQRAQGFYRIRLIV